MSRTLFECLVGALGAAFALFFFTIVFPPLLQSGDIVGAFAAGFVNPFAAGYSTDVILCALILFVWIVYERSTKGVRHGWIAALLCFVPGVAVGLALYLVLRARQLERPRGEGAGG